MKSMASDNDKRDSLASMEKELGYKVEEHEKVHQIKPFVKQIIKDMYQHNEDF